MLHEWPDQKCKICKAKLHVFISQILVKYFSKYVHEFEKFSLLYCKFLQKVTKKPVYVNFFVIFNRKKKKIIFKSMKSHRVTSKITQTKKIARFFHIKEKKSTKNDSRVIVKIDTYTSLIPKK